MIWMTPTVDGIRREMEVLNPFFSFALFGESQDGRLLLLMLHCSHKFLVNELELDITLNA
jgi:hypothetical protein